ncbi:unnamed protein product [Strongylus vulgaris]|uniref:Uncharacterized protein n=1 Tax=Strongylus vulgaris TaxID=40348 RepID=A0A3P7M2J2_STRVU|nr:unnamed protein product [Strongylus vulgaris]
MEEVIRKEKSFYKFVVGDFNTKIGMSTNSSWGSIGLGDLEQDSSTTFSPTEGGAPWTSQWYHPSVVVQINTSFEQKCDSAESWKRISVTVIEEGGKTYMTASDWKSS